MKRHFLRRLATLKEIPCSERNKFTSRMSRIGFVIALCLTEPILSAAQNSPGAPAGPGRVYPRCGPAPSRRTRVARQPPRIGRNRQ